MKKPTIQILILIFFVTSIVNSQNLTPELIADRPDVTESATIIPVGFYQFETGFVYQKNKFYNGISLVEEDNITLGTTLIRYGINDFIEFRFGGEYFLGEIKSNDIKETLSGLNGFMIGTKLQLWKDRIITNAAILLEINLPFGNENLRPDKFEPNLILAFEQDITHNVALGTNFGISNNSKQNKNIFSFSSALGMSLTERFGCFVEYYGQSTKNEIPDHYFDSGITYLQKQNLQIDLSVGKGLFSENTNWFLSVGLTLRFPY